MKGQSGLNKSITDLHDTEGITIEKNENGTVMECD